MNDPISLLQRANKLAIMRENTDLWNENMQRNPIMAVQHGALAIVLGTKLGLNMTPLLSEVTLHVPARHIIDETLRTQIENLISSKGKSMEAPSSTR